MGVRTTNFAAMFFLTESTLHWLILLSVIGLPSIAYLITATGRRGLRRAGFVVLAVLFVFFAFVWTIAYAIPAADEFKYFALKIVLPDIIFVWIIAVAAWAFAIRFVLRAIRVPR